MGGDDEDGGDDGDGGDGRPATKWHKKKNKGGKVRRCNRRSAGAVGMS